MLLALGAASSALDILKSLTSKTSSPKSTGPSQEPASPFDLSGGVSASASTSTSGSNASASSKISPATMSALLAAQSQASSATTSPASTSRSDALKSSFSQLDADGNGQISKSEFEDALGAGGTNIAKADDVFGKLDKDGDGNVSLDEMSSALKGAGKGHHHHAAGGADDEASADGSDPQKGTSRTSVTNSDGSITTSLTYPDGSKVTMTTAVGASSAATSSYNFIDQMIAREAKAISSSASASLSVSA